MVKINKLLIILVILCFAVVLLGETELRPYKLIHADSLNAHKIEDAYVSELTGSVHFFYGDTEFYCDQAFLYERDKIVRMHGNVRVFEDTLSLIADRASYFRLQEKLELEENVLFKETHADSTWRTYAADRVVYLREMQTVESWGDVKIIDSRENVSGNCGYITYNIDQGFGYLSQNPVLTMADNDTLNISSRKIEYYDDYQKIVAIFDVLTLMQDYTLTSDFLIYYSEQEKATYRGKPELFSDLFDARGSEVTLFFRENKMDRAELSDSCKVVYKVEENGAKENWVEADEMSFRFWDGVIQECRALGNVESFYIQQKNEKKRKDFMKNVTKGDKLNLYMNDEGYIKQICISGNITGNYTFENNANTYK